GAMSAVLQ
nr:Chain C, 3C-like proteinase [Severe acute respiratory syndrome coronavirus 2]